MEPLVSIIVPIYNGEKYLDSCMECLLQQTYANLEIILVDDGSRDHSPAMCDDYAKRDSRIRVFHQSNKGLSGARNTGIDNATGKYICFFDVDDMITTELIQDNLDWAEEQSADVVMFGFWYYDVDKNELIPNQLEKAFAGTGEDYFYQFLPLTMDKEVFNAPWNKMIKRSLLIENGLQFDTRYPIYEDIIFAPKLLGAAQKVVVNNNLYYKYFVRSSGSLITKFYENLFEAVTQAWTNGMSYCNQYIGNEVQKSKFDALYVRHIFTHIKQISCKEDLDKQKKYELLQKIFSNKNFLSALNNVKLSGKKKIIRVLINHKKYRTCCAFYRISGKLQTK